LLTDIYVFVNLGAQTEMHRIFEYL